MGCQAFVVSPGVLALGECGGRTQVATVVPAARYHALRVVPAVVFALLGVLVLVLVLAGGGGMPV